MIRQYQVLSGQTIYDVCLMTYGTLDNLFKLMLDNGFPGVNAYPLAGSLFAWDDTLVYDQKVFISNTTNRVNYATRASNTGSIYYNVAQAGAPKTVPVIVPPPNVEQPIAKDAYFYVYADNPSITYDGTGNFVYTDSRLVGITDYSVYASQLGNMIEPPNIAYDAASGSFTILIPDFYIVDQYRLTVFLNHIDL